MKPFLSSVLLPLTLTISSFAATETSSPETPSAPAAGTEAASISATATGTAAEKLEIPGVTLQHGPSIAKLGNVAELKLPEGYAFVGPDSLDKFFELTRNFRNGKEVGVLLSPERWMLFFDYNDVGYVKDDDKDKLDAAKFYATLKEGEKSSNEARRQRGWSELQFQGWEKKPYYDEKTNNLKWALRLSSSADQHQSISINQDIRLLGRGGYVTATLVTDAASFATDSIAADNLLTDFSYVSGQKYAEYKKGDKLAEYGLAALVVGGAGAVALKAGLFAYLAKFWKAIVAAVVAVGVGIAKFFKKISGRA
jgi:uncharacterized membrane-anchored protein